MNAVTSPKSGYRRPQGIYFNIEQRAATVLLNVEFWTLNLTFHSAESPSFWQGNQAVFQEWPPLQGRRQMFGRILRLQEFVHWQTVKCFTGHYWPCVVCCMSADEPKFDVKTIESKRSKRSMYTWLMGCVFCSQDQGPWDPQQEQDWSAGSGEPIQPAVPKYVLESWLEYLKITLWRGELHKCQVFMILSGYVTLSYTQALAQMLFSLKQLQSIIWGTGLARFGQDGTHLNEDDPDMVLRLARKERMTLRMLSQHSTVMRIELGKTRDAASLGLIHVTLCSWRSSRQNWEAWGWLRWQEEHQTSSQRCRPLKLMFISWSSIWLEWLKIHEKLRRAIQISCSL